MNPLFKISFVFIALMSAFIFQSAEAAPKPQGGCANGSTSPYCCANNSPSPFCCANGSMNEDCSMLPDSRRGNQKAKEAKDEEKDFEFYLKLILKTVVKAFAAILL